MSELIKINDNSRLNVNQNNNVQIITGRVIDIILNDKHPEFKNLGVWDSIGVIFFDASNKITSFNGDLKSLPYAKPLFSYKKHYPLKSELVYIISFSNFESQNNLSLTDYYYLDILNIWNHPHHNALPQLNGIDNKISNQYNRVGEGNTQITKNSSTNIDLGNTFVEKQNIKPLLPQEGDLIFESRFGSSIRFNSNNIIIRNGQNPNLDNKGWVPNNEDINNDLGSIYFSNSGSIPIQVASNNLKSFNLVNKNNNISKIIYPDNLKIPSNISSNDISNLETPLTSSNINQLPSTTNNIGTGSYNVNDDFIVPEENFQPSEFESLEEVKFNGGKSTSPTEVSKNENNVLFTNTTFKINNINSFGKINTLLVNKYAYPILDMIAYAEGTIFYGNNDGYDVIFSGKIISGWNVNYIGGHPNVYIKFGNTTSSGAGRYGFLKSTWDETVKGPFNKNNQDFGAYKLILNRGINPLVFKNIYENSNKSVNENLEFLKLLDKISYIWASVSDSKGNFRYSGQGTSKPDKLYFIYKEALKKYKL